MKKLFLLSASAFALTVGAATASTIHEVIWTTGHRGLQSSGAALDYTSDTGIKLQASGHTLSGHGFGAQPLRIGEYRNGLGITSPDTCHWWGFTWSCDDHKVDGKGTNEIVKLTFDREVTVKKLYFQYEDHNDSFEFLMVDGDRGGSYYPNQTVYDFGYIGGYRFRQEWTGTMIGVGAAGNHDEWKLKGVAYSYEHVAPVPLPAAGLMLLAGVGGLAALKRRKKS